MPAEEVGTEPTGRASRLDELVDLTQHGSQPRGPMPRAPAGDAGCLVGTCLSDVHPTLTGRVHVRWNDAAGGARERWIPTLLHLPVRPQDRVLIVQPQNFDEPVVVGVLDGFARRPEAPRAGAAQVELKLDEALQIVGMDGQAVIELFQTDTGPVVRLLQDDVNLELSGALRIRASQIELRAGAGSVEIVAADEVNVRGEVVTLN